MIDSLLALSINQHTQQTLYYLEMENAQMLKFINLARCSPTSFLPIIQVQLSFFINDLQISLSDSFLYETSEGRAAWIQSKQFLLQQDPIKPLVKHEGLCAVAAEKVNRFSSIEAIETMKEGRQQLSRRIKKHCQNGFGFMAELIGFDLGIQSNFFEETILGLIIDDGIKSRGNRKVIFNDRLRYVGWASKELEGKKFTVFEFMEDQTKLEKPTKRQSKFKKNQSMFIIGKQNFDFQKNI